MKPLLFRAPGPFTREELLKELERELTMRHKVYAARVENYEWKQGLNPDTGEEESAGGGPDFDRIASRVANSGQHPPNFRKGFMPRGLAQYQIGLLEYLYDLVQDLPEQRVYSREAAFRYMKAEPGTTFTTPDHSTYTTYWWDGTQWMSRFVELDGEPKRCFDYAEHPGEYPNTLPREDIWIKCLRYEAPHPKAGELQ